MDDAKAVRRAALNAKHIHQEAHQRKNVCEKGALGALPQGYGVGAPCEVGANKERQCHNQDACNPLAQNPRLQNNHFCPIVVAGIPPRPQAQAGAVHAGTVVTPVPVCAVKEGAVDHPAAVFQFEEQQAAPPQLPMLKEFAAMAMPPPAPNAGAELLAASGQAGAANNVARKATIVAQRFVANAATAGVGAPIIVD